MSLQSEKFLVTRNLSTYLLSFLTSLPLSFRSAKRMVGEGCFGGLMSQSINFLIFHNNIIGSIKKISDV